MAHISVGQEKQTDTRTRGGNETGVLKKIINFLKYDELTRLPLADARWCLFLGVARIDTLFMRQDRLVILSCVCDTDT